MSDIIPSGDRADSDARHEADHANIAHMLGLLHQKGCICNVEDPAFAGGARGDGTTDDTAAINAAIQAAHGFPNGGIVEFPCGVYATSAPLVSAGDDVWFVGPHGLKANVEGGNLPSTLMHGIATYGYVGAWTLHDFIVASIANTSSIGVNQVADSTGARPQGNSITRGLVQYTMGGGVILSAGDATIEHIHTQSTGGNGSSITGRGGDTRLSQCRGDLARMNGFYINVPCGRYLGMVQLSNCSTQRNGNNGIEISNSVVDRSSVVYCTGSVFQGDGTSGSPHSGIRLSGPVGAVFTGCGVHVNSGIPAGGRGTWPSYAITTAAGSVAPPVFVDIRGGFCNAAVAFSNKINAPLVSVVDALEYHGGPNGAPTRITAL